MCECVSVCARDSIIRLMNSIICSRNDSYNGIGCLLAQRLSLKAAWHCLLVWLFVYVMCVPYLAACILAYLHKYTFQVLAKWMVSVYTITMWLCQIELCEAKPFLASIRWWNRVMWFGVQYDELWMANTIAVKLFIISDSSDRLISFQWNMNTGAINHDSPIVRLIWKQLKSLGLSSMVIKVQFHRSNGANRFNMKS